MAAEIQKIYFKRAKNGGRIASYYRLSDFFFFIMCFSWGWNLLCLERKKSIGRFISFNKVSKLFQN